MTPSNNTTIEGGGHVLQEDRGGLCGFEEREVAAIREEGQIAGFGMVNAGNTADFEVVRRGVETAG